ncbi:murein L,D-transpeptidase family protein [Pseudomonas sp. zjy_14]|uniref:L,D-transpeptidase family protein n=1 Tax=Pseudomonas sp. zjy_14 TaxID=3367264 RepID=UPI00370B7F5B
MKNAIKIFTLIPVALSLIACPKKAEITTESADPCREHRSVVLVQLKKEQLSLCKNGATVKAYDVALGSGGFGKTRAGDEKTPIGTYPLEKPRPSTDKKFHTFIKIGYPTPKQIAQGYTGNDVGIHGPHKYWAWAGGANTWINWTNGCVAVKSNQDIIDISQWVESEQVRTVTLEL